MKITDERETRKVLKKEILNKLQDLGFTFNHYSSSMSWCDLYLPSSFRWLKRLFDEADATIFIDSDGTPRNITIYRNYEQMIQLLDNIPEFEKLDVVLR